jgi:hypothetical protein
MVQRLLADPAAFYRENKLELPKWLERDLEAGRSPHASPRL